MKLKAFELADEIAMSICQGTRTVAYRLRYTNQSESLNVGDKMKKPKRYSVA